MIATPRRSKWSPELMLRHIQRIKQEATPERLRQLWYLPPLALAMGLTMVRLLVMARLLDVEEFAKFSKGILVSGSFGMLGCLGLQMLLQRNWPMLLVKGQEYRGLVLAAQANLVAIGCAVAGLVLVAIGVTVSNLAPSILIVGIIHGLSQQLFIIATIESRSRGRTIEFAGQNLVRALAILSVGVFFAAITGSAMIALIIEGTISLFLSLTFFQRSTRYAAAGQLAIYRLAARRLGKVEWNAAFIMMAVSVVVFLQYNIDRWIASDQLDSSQFAHYSFACIVLTIGQSVQALVNSSLFPFIARRYALIGHVSAFRISMLISIAIFCIGTVVAIPASYAANYAIHTWYPKYLDAVELLIPFLLIAILRLSDFWSSFLLIAHRQNLLFALNAAVSLLVVATFIVYIWFFTNHVISMLDVALMAGTLSAANYAVAAGAAWLIGRKAC